MNVTDFLNGRRVLWIALSYVLLALPGYLLQVSPTYGSPVFPSSGLALAVAIVYPHAGILGIALGSLALQVFLNGFFGLSDHHSIGLYVLIASGAVLQAYIGGWWLRWGKRHQMQRMASISDAVYFLTWAGLLSTLVSATVANLSLLAYGVLDPRDFFYHWMHWYVGDAFGVLVCYPLVMCLLQPNDPLWRHRRRPMLMPTVGLWVLLLALLLTFKKWETQQQADKLNTDGRTLLETVVTAVNAQNEALYALAGFIEATPAVNFEHFEKFATSALIRHPEVAGFSFNHRVSAPARAEFEQASGRASPLGRYRITEQGPENTWRPASARAEYVPVKFIVPLSAHRAVVGFDILSEPLRRAAVEKVLVSGDIVTTPALQLVQDNLAYTGVLRLAPLYEAQQDPALPVSGITGFAVAVLKVDQMMQQALGHWVPEGLHVELWDRQDPNQPRLLYTSDKREPMAGQLAGWQAWQQSFDVGQREWTLSVAPAKVAYFHQNDWLVGTMVALMCAGLCIFVQAFLMDITVWGYGTDQKLQQVLQTLRDMVGRATGSAWDPNTYADLPSLARHITELQHTEEVQRQALTQQKNALDQHNIVSILDAHGRIVYVNQKLCDFLGYSSQELLGRHHRVTASGGHTLGFFRALLRQVRRGQVWQGEICERHKNGTLYWGYTTVLPLLDLGARRPERYIVIRTDITPLKDAEARLEHASRAKSAFLSTMSHEIRTPLNALLGTAQVLERTPLHAEQTEMVQEIVKSGGLLLSQLNDILDFSKIESGRFTVETLPFGLSEVLQQVESLMGATATAKGLAFHIGLTEVPTRCLLGDRLRLTQVLINLCSNAIKFTASGSVTVTVRSVPLDGQRLKLHFAVADTGVGIPAEQQQKLFEPFVQADSSVTRQFGGTGLGLSICKRLVELMGGQIGLFSEPGVGTTFWFELAYALDSTLPSEHCASDPVASGRLSQGAQLVQRHLLVVDDNPMNRKMLQRLLSQEGAQVSLAEDGPSALETLAQSPHAFDAVLMDVQMPGMDGLTAIGHVRQRLGLQNLPILACSAGVYQQDQLNALAAGADGFVAKPIQRDDLLAALARCWSGEGVALAAAPPPEPTPVAGVPQWGPIDGLDVAALREQFGDDWDFAQTLLQMFAQELERLWQALPADGAWPLSDDAQHTWGQRLHKLRGSAGTVGAQALVEATRRLEDGLRSPTEPAALQAEWAVLLQITRDLHARLPIQGV